MAASTARRRLATASTSKRTCLAGWRRRLAGSHARGRRRAEAASCVEARSGAAAVPSWRSRWRRLCAAHGAAGRHRAEAIPISSSRPFRKARRRRCARRSSAAGSSCRPTISATRSASSPRPLKASPQSASAEAALGYLSLARGRADNALPAFDRALAREPQLVSALVGRGYALVELKREGEAVASFEAAIKADPSLTDLQARVDVIRFRATQDLLAARQERHRRRSAGGCASGVRAGDCRIARFGVPLPRAGRRGAPERRARPRRPSISGKALELDPGDARAQASAGRADGGAAVTWSPPCRCTKPRGRPTRASVSGRNAGAVARRCGRPEAAGAVPRAFPKRRA